jgi:hypothetical protein
MGCCGKKFGKATSIIKGYALRALERDSVFAAERRRVCDDCDELTFMGWREYIAWMRAQGIRKILRNLDSLTDLIPLPKQSARANRNEKFCRLCKCWIQAKVSGRVNCRGKRCG